VRRDFSSVALAVARRQLNHAYKNPAFFLPATIFPLIFLVAFAGGLSSVQHVPGFDFASGYTAFQFVFVFLQSAAFSGVFSGFSVAADFESGFARRLLLGAPRRGGLIAGYLLASLGRFAGTGVIITIVALIAGMQVGGDGVELVGLVGLALLVNVATCLWGIGVAMRAKSLQAGPFMQTPVFVALFLAPVYVPLGLLEGWLHAVASYNPLTAVLTAGRGFISGQPTDVLLGFVCGMGLGALFAVWAVRGLRRAERFE
jgi:ABC-2 type transport system permease protein